MLCAVTPTRTSCSYTRAVLVEEKEVPAVSLNQAGAAVDELSQRFPSLGTTSTFYSALIPHFLHHIPSLCCCFSLCWAALSHQAAATSESALAGGFGAR